MKRRLVFRAFTCVCILMTAMLFAVLQSYEAGGAGPITGGVPLQIKQTQFCSVLAPSDWTFWTSPTATTAEAVSADGALYSGWTVLAVDKRMAPVHGDLFGEPQMSIRFMTDRILRGIFVDSSTMRYTSYLRPFLNYFTLSRFESHRTRGLVFYRIYPGRSQEQYTESVYWAIARKFRRQEGLKIAAGVTVSLRCVTQSGPTALGWRVPLHAGAAVRPGCGAGEALGSYQKELGIEHAHSILTGQSYLVDPATQWNETGPYGPGYYQRFGYGLEKLALGHRDRC